MLGDEKYMLYSIQKRFIHQGTLLKCPLFCCFCFEKR